MKVGFLKIYAVRANDIKFYVTAKNIGEAILLFTLHRPTWDIQEIKKLDYCTLIKKQDEAD